MTRRFDLEHPVVLAPMAQVADGRLAAAVSEAGGLGLIGAGYADGDRLAGDFARAGAARVGCGFITWRLAQEPELLDLALRHAPAAVMLSFGDPAPFVERIRAAGIPVICQIHTLAQAREVVSLGADVVVAQGGEAGGHGSGERTTFTLVPEVADLLAATVPDEPARPLLLAAGGVADGRGMAAALVLGADGVLAGTRLWACAEANVPRSAQAAALAASGDDTVRTGIFDIIRRYAWPPPYALRTLRNSTVGRWYGAEDELRDNLPAVEARYRDALHAEDWDIANVTVGEGVGQIDRVMPAAEVLTRMTQQAREALARTTGFG